MQKIQTTLTTEAVFSDDGKKRYLLKKIWDEKLPKLSIVMLAPNEAAGISLDTTTHLVLNNADALGFGSVAIVNLSAVLNDYALQSSMDKDNKKAMLQAFQQADVIVYAPGVGKAKNKSFISRQAEVAEILKPYEQKLKCICTKEGKSRLQHPLSPAVRRWTLDALSIAELLPPRKEEKNEK